MQNRPANRPERATDPGIDRGFVRLALGAAVVTFLLIVIGAVTRVSESGMGCGTYWPSCDGRLIPEFTNAHTVIEFGHRLFAPVVGLFTLAVVIQAWRRHRHEAAIFVPAVLGFLLYFVQAGLGALTVALSNQWVSVLLHLANSLLLLACYLAAWLGARRSALITDMKQGAARFPLVELLPATALAFVVVLVGAAVAGNDAAKACVGYPLCAGQIWPADQGPLQMLNMLHRLAAGALGVMVLLLVIQARQGGVNPLARRVVMAALGLFILQAALGALVVLIPSREWLTVIKCLHVAFAAALWSIMVIASVISWLQLPSPRAKMNPLVAVRSATTSS